MQLFTLRWNCWPLHFVKQLPSMASFEPVLHFAHQIRPTPTICRVLSGGQLWVIETTLTQQQSSQIGRACYFLHLCFSDALCEGTSGEMSGRFHDFLVQISQEFLNALSLCINICEIFQFFPQFPKYLTIAFTLRFIFRQY